MATVAFNLPLQMGGRIHTIKCDDKVVKLTTTDLNGKEVAVLLETSDLSSLIAKLQKLNIG